MKKIALLLALLATFVSTAPTFAADKIYQISGKVTQSTSDRFKVRGKVQDLEIMRDKDTKIVGGNLGKGSTVVAMYKNVNGVPHATEVHVTK
jgi:hypothetical protein